ncbi:MAG: 2-phospho-L-lactate guanylyltransferase [Dehalococcoidia bacterium]
MTTVVVPLKPLAEAKSRFRGVYDDGARAALVRAMLTDVLAAVRAAHDGALLLVASDSAYDDIAARFDVARLDDRGHDYNSAVASALRSEAVRDAGAALILPADLPRATPEDVARVREALRTAEVVLVPAHDGGTGALGLRPPGAIAPAFGPGSAAAHRDAAQAAARPFEVLHCPSLAFDVDTPTDLDRDTASLGPATRDFLAAHAAAGRR